MGRRKIKIEKIIDERNKQVTFTKRKAGLIKKARELSTLCECDIGLIIKSDSGKLFHYSNKSVEQVFRQFAVFESGSDVVCNYDRMVPEPPQFYGNDWGEYYRGCVGTFDFGGFLPFNCDCGRKGTNF